jgi:3-oxoacyl-[acyl-carrier-protein] synthase-1
MREVYAVSDNIISSLGFTSNENFSALKQEETGIKLHEDAKISPSPFWASLINQVELTEKFAEYGPQDQYTRFEKIVILSMLDALKSSDIDITSNKTLVILSTTKGNVDLFDKRLGSRFDASRAYLWHTAQIVQHFFKLSNTPMVVSNACISGVLAIIIGARLIRSGKFDHIVVCGADLVTEFVLSGFNSFLSLCSGPCKPFDKDRQGLSLGEAAGTLILTADKKYASRDVVFVGPGFSSNDANHISGPSRTGEGLYIAIKKTLQLHEKSVDYISAHGTATSYNDEMESIALNRMGLQTVPVNSFKGYWGHTLGAAGVIESISGIYSLKHNLLFKTLGYSEPGVTQPIAVINETQGKRINSFLKIASGFGGCNAALLFNK